MRMALYASPRSLKFLVEPDASGEVHDALDAQPKMVFKPGSPSPLRGKEPPSGPPGAVVAPLVSRGYRFQNRFLPSASFFRDCAGSYV